MGPTSTPPWRVIDAPPTGNLASGVGAAPSAEDGDGASGAGSTTLVRLDAGRLGLLGLAVAAFAAAAVAAVIVLGGSDPAVIVDAASPLAVADGPGTATDAAIGGRDGGSGMLVAEIVGAVVKPGVYRLPPGSRVADLLTAAGGYGARVDTVRTSSVLNLAAPLRDGDQVRVPSRDDLEDFPPAGSLAAGADGPGPIDINVASQAELEELPGIGPATAHKIIAAREEAPFGTIDELRTRGVLGEKTFDKLRDLVTVR